MKHTTSRALAVALVGLLILSAGAAAVAPTVDTETTTTSTTSEITDGMTVTNFAANDSMTSTLQAKYDSDNPKVVIKNEDNETIKSLNSSDMKETNASNNYYNATINHSVWSDVPIAPNGTTTVYLTLVNNTQATNPDTTNVSITLEGADGRTVRVVDADLGTDVFSTSSAGIDVPFTSMTVSIPFFGSSGDKSTYSPSSVPINGSNSTVKIAYRNSTGASSLSTVADSLDSGAWAKSIVMTSDKGPIKVYVDSAPSDVNTSETYAVYDSASDDLTIHTGSEYDGETSMSGMNVNANAGFIEQLTTYGVQVPGTDMTFDGSSIPGLGMLGAGSSLTAAGAFLFFRPQQAS